MSQKYEHAKDCISTNNRECPVCNTPWPKKQDTPTEKYLKSISYYNNRTKVYRDDTILDLPKGINGEELIKIAKILKSEYDIITKGTSDIEVIKRGASEGYDKI